MSVSVFLGLAVTFAQQAVAHGGNDQSAKSAKAKVPESERRITDEPIADYRIELLDLAFGAASAFPPQPHIKNRGRAQEEVITACFELGQPLRAIRYANDVGDWRRGSAYADYAFYCAKRGNLDQAASYLPPAANIAANEEDWRRDQIRSKIAAAYIVAGQPERAAEFESRLETSELGRVFCARVMITPDDQFNDRVNGLDHRISEGDFDVVAGALRAFVELHSKFYAQEARRKLLEERIKSQWNGMPFQIRIDLLRSLAANALDHKDSATALRLIDDAQGYVDTLKWLPQDGIALNAQLAAIRARAGDAERARTQLASGMAMFNSERENIYDVFRGGALRPIAEAFAALGDTDNALLVYSMAADEAVVNVNSRPRTNDLVAICCSLAKCGVEPSPELWSKLRKIREGLGDPW